MEKPCVVEVSDVSADRIFRNVPFASELAADDTAGDGQMPEDRDATLLRQRALASSIFASVLMHGLAVYRGFVLVSSDEAASC